MKNTIDLGSAYSRRSLRYKGSSLGKRERGEQAYLAPAFHGRETILASTGKRRNVLKVHRTLCRLTWQRALDGTQQQGGAGELNIKKSTRQCAYPSTYIGGCRLAPTLDGTVRKLLASWLSMNSQTPSLASTRNSSSGCRTYSVTSGRAMTPT